MGREVNAMGVRLAGLTRSRLFIGGVGDGIARMIFRGGAISFLLATIGLVFGFVSHVMLSRTLGASQYGLMPLHLVGALGSRRLRQQAWTMRYCASHQSTSIVASSIGS